MKDLTVVVMELCWSRKSRGFENLGHVLSEALPFVAGVLAGSNEPPCLLAAL